MQHGLRDLTTEDDVASVVAAFYRDIETDPTLGPFFGGTDWAQHRPRMVAFWSSVVFQTGGYHGRPFDPHARMPGLDRPHFEAWLARWHATVDARFAGEAAERMKARAEQIAGVFQVKLGLWRVTDSPAAESSSPA